MTDPHFTPSQFIPQGQIDNAYDKIHADLITARIALDRIATRGEYHSAPIAKAALAALNNSVVERIEKR